MAKRLPEVDDEVSVYWQTGCTSCLRTKEFLSKHGIGFRSRNVLEDETAFEELARLGLRRVPIVVRGDDWADGQVLADIARLVGIPWGETRMLPPEELRRRLNAIMHGTERFLRQLPEDSLQTHLPNRPRSYADLVFHIYNIIDAFVEHEEGVPLAYEAYYRLPELEMQTIDGISGYGHTVAQRLNDWFDQAGASVDWSAAARVYYGAQTLHEFLERTTWHSGQHARQLMWVLERMGIAPDRPLGEETFDGLPMPAQVWDDDGAPPAEAFAKPPQKTA